MRNSCTIESIWPIRKRAGADVSNSFSEASSSSSLSSSISLIPPSIYFGSCPLSEVLILIEFISPNLSPNRRNSCSLISSSSRPVIFFLASLFLLGFLQGAYLLQFVLFKLPQIYPLISSAAHKLVGLKRNAVPEVMLSLIEERKRKWVFDKSIDSFSSYEKIFFKEAEG